MIFYKQLSQRFSQFQSDSYFNSVQFYLVFWMIKTLLTLTEIMFVFYWLNWLRAWQLIFAVMNFCSLCLKITSNYCSIPSAINAGQLPSFSEFDHWLQLRSVPCFLMRFLAFERRLGFYSSWNASCCCCGTVGETYRRQLSWSHDGWTLTSSVTQ